MPNILLTNDDGVNAPGLMALARAFDHLGSVTVVAPERNWSVSGHPKTLHKPLRLTPRHWPDGRAVHACSGAPPDCVALALLGAVEHDFDLVVSGINSSFNLGTDVLYSGTVAAAMEAIINDVPAMAVSVGAVDGLHAPSEPVWSSVALLARRLGEQIFEKGLPTKTLLNVNVPKVAAEEIRGVQITRLGRRIYRDVLVARDDPWGRPYYWIGGEYPTGVPEDGSDIGAVENGYVSVTPLGIDLTNYHAVPSLENWSWA